METTICDDLSSHEHSIHLRDLPSEFLFDMAATSALLDSISLFEIVGSRMMLKVPFARWDESMHEHCSDEVNHTLLVQEHARKLRFEMDASELFKEQKLNYHFHNITNNYLNRLFRRIYKFTIAAGRENEKFQVYSYAIISFLIERRILKIYPLLAQYSPNIKVRKMAKTIIGDEKRHMELVGEKLVGGIELAATTKQELIQIEEAFAESWKSELLEAYHAI